MAERFTPFYEWVAESLDLTLPEALVLCRVKMWGNAGCWESYKTLAKKLKLSERTVIRAVGALLSKKLIKRVKKGKKEKRLYFNFDLTGLPLVDSTMPACHSKNNKGARESADYDRVAQTTMTECHTTISSTKQEETKEKIELLGDLLTTQNRPLSKTETNKRRQLLLNQIDSMVKG